MSRAARLAPRRHRCWHVGDGAAAGPGTGVVALDVGQARDAAGRGAEAVPFHELMAGLASVEPAEEVRVRVPLYRGRRFLELTSWLVCARLAEPGARAVWEVERPRVWRFVSNVLRARGWELAASRTRKAVELVGRVPPGAQPAVGPQAFSVRLGRRELRFAADFGVFSPGQVDDGTLLLFEVASEMGPVPSLADVGTGYGALAIGLVANGLAPRAVATEVDSVALWLAGSNARTAATPLAAGFEPDPAAVEATELTVCNFPTHAPGPGRELLLRGLAARARRGRALLVVHSALEAHYRRRLEAAGLRLAVTRGPAHAVIDASS